MVRELVVGNVGRFSDYYNANTVLISSYGLEEFSCGDVVKFYYKNKKLELCSMNYKVLIKTSKYLLLIDEKYYDDFDREVYICNIN